VPHDLITPGLSNHLTSKAKADDADQRKEDWLAANDRSQGKKRDTKVLPRGRWACPFCGPKVRCSRVYINPEGLFARGVYTVLGSIWSRWPMLMGCTWDGQKSVQEGVSRPDFPAGWAEISVRKSIHQCFSSDTTMTLGLPACAH
jgi:hypothetical protein